MLELWKRELLWGDPLTDDLMITWNAIEEYINTVTSTHVSRQYFPETDDSCELHCFIDTINIKGYRAAIYLYHLWQRVDCLQ